MIMPVSPSSSQEQTAISADRSAAISKDQTINDLINKIELLKNEISSENASTPLPSKTNDCNLDSPDHQVMDLIKEIEGFLSWVKHLKIKNVEVAFEQIKERLDKIKEEFDNLDANEKQEFLAYGQEKNTDVGTFAKSFL